MILYMERELEFLLKHKENGWLRNMERIMGAYDMLELAGVYKTYEDFFDYNEFRSKWNDIIKKEYEKGGLV